MDPRINQVLNELIKLDPTFAAQKTELENILMSMLAIQPNPVIDSNFVRKLRVKLLDNAESVTQLVDVWLKFKNNFMKKIVISVSAAVVVLVVALIGLQKLNLKNSPIGELSFGSDVRVSRAVDGAFGNLATLTLAKAGKGGGGATPASAELGTDATRSSVAYGMGGSGVASDKMIAPFYEPVNYKYVYKGEELKLESDKLDVLKKQTPDASEFVLGLDSLGLGLVNLNSFPGSKPQSVSFNQVNGYNIYIDFQNGTASISGYFDVMPMAMDSKACPVDGCPAPEQIKGSDIPEDSVIISVADQFLADHGISTSAYGDPEVANYFRVQNYATLKANPKALIYWPDYIDVIYPLKIDNDEVYDESGNKIGLMVGVNIRTDRVTSVYNLSTQNYQASSYDAETDVARIRKLAEQGGMYGYPGDIQGKSVEIELGSPTLQYVSMWDYQMNSSQQVLVPSLVFPITQQPLDGSFYRNAVVVPLIKDILNRDNGEFGGGPVKIMESGTAGSGKPSIVK